MQFIKTSLWTYHLLALLIQHLDVIELYKSKPFAYQTMDNSYVFEKKGASCAYLLSKSNNKQIHRTMKVWPQRCFFLYRSARSKSFHFQFSGDICAYTSSTCDRTRCPALFFDHWTLALTACGLKEMYVKTVKFPPKKGSKIVRGCSLDSMFPLTAGGPNDRNEQSAINSALPKTHSGT